MRNKAQASKVHVYTPRSKRMQPQTFILMHDKAELPNNDARDKQSKCVIKRKRVKYMCIYLVLKECSRKHSAKSIRGSSRMTATSRSFLLPDNQAIYCRKQRNKAQTNKVHVYIPRSKRMQPQAFILMHDKAELPNNDARDKQSKCVIKRKRIKYMCIYLVLKECSRKHSFWCTIKRSCRTTTHETNNLNA